MLTQARPPSPAAAAIQRSRALCFEREPEAFVALVQASWEVATPAQFFMWQQLHLNRFVPHGAWAGWSGHPDLPSRSRLLRVTHNRPLAPALQQRLLSADAPWWSEATRQWRVRGDVLWLPRAELCDEAPASSDCAGLWVAGIAPACDGDATHLHVLVCWSDGGEAQAAPSQAQAAALRACLPIAHQCASRAYASQLPDGAARVRARPANTRREAPRGTTLTPREIEVLAAVRQHGRSAAAAQALGLSPLTVKNHLRHIMVKLGVGTRAQAIAQAMAERWIA